MNEVQYFEVLHKNTPKGVNLRVCELLFMMTVPSAYKAFWKKKTYIISVYIKNKNLWNTVAEKMSSKRTELCVHAQWAEINISTAG